MKKRALILIVILFIIAGGGYFLYSMLIIGETESILSAGKTIDTSFDTKIFSEEKFNDLKQNITLPIEVGQKGKIDPFMKF